MEFFSILLPFHSRFSAFQLPNATSFGQIQPPCVGAWISHSGAYVPHACQCSPNSTPRPLVLFYGLFIAFLLYLLSIVVILLLLCFVGYCLLTFYWFVSLAETFVIEFVLVPLFTIVLVTDFSSTFIASASFRWLLLVTSGDSYRFALICVPFAYETALCNPLRGLGHLFFLFPTFCNYFRTTLVCFGSIIGEPTPFLFLGSSLPFK